MGITLALVCLLAVTVTDRLISESVRLLDSAGREAPVLLSELSALLDRLIERFPFLAAVAQEGRMRDLFSRAAESALTAASSRLPEWIGQTVSGLPAFFFFAVMCVIAAFYIAADYDRVNAFLLAQLPTRAVTELRRLRRRMVTTGFRYLRAYAILTAITFGELFLGFSLLRIDYAFTLALFTAFVDVLPVLGIGTVLIPWGIVMLLTGKSAVGIGLLTLFGIVSLLRQFIEPRLLGVTLGIPPLAALIALYVGYRFAGVAGMLLFPILLIVLCDLREAGTIVLWRDPEKAAEEK